MKSELTVRQTNPTGKGKSRLSVYKGSELIARIEVAKRCPYKYLKGLNRSKHFKELERQLLPKGYTLRDIGLGK